MSVADFEKQYQTQAPSLSGFGKNVLKSTGKFFGDIGEAIVHPIDTATGAFQVGAGAVEKPVRKGLEFIGGKPIEPTPEEQNFDALVESYKRRYGSIPQALHTAYTDPVGVAADVSTLAGGAGAVARGVRVGAEVAGAARLASGATRVANAAKTAEAMTNPLNAVTAAGGAALRSAPVQNWARRRYESALKIPPGVDRTERMKQVETGLQSRIPVSEGGLNIVEQRIDELNQQIADKIAQGAKQGETVNPEAVASRVDQTKPIFGTQVNPEADLNALEASKQEFLRQHSYEAPYTKVEPWPGGPENAPQPFLKIGEGTTRVVEDIPIAEAQRIKQGTYRQLKDKSYGELKTASVEAQKQLARGLKEEIVKIFPEIAGINEQDSRMIALRGSLERFANRQANRDTIGIGGPMKVMAGHALAGSAGTIPALLMSALEFPEIKSRLAILMTNPAPVGKWRKYVPDSKTLTPASRLPAAQEQEPAPQMGRGGIVSPPLPRFSRRGMIAPPGDFRTVPPPPRFSNH
jgi:hypothetical protein